MQETALNTVWGQRFGHAAEMRRHSLYFHIPPSTITLQSLPSTNLPPCGYSGGPTVEFKSNLTPNATLNTSMKTGHGPGEYQTPTPTHTTSGADVPVPGFASGLWEKLRPVDIQGRICGISRQFAGAGWKNLPQELVDEILGYLLDDLRALKACSLTCRCLFSAARPLIHQRLVCLGSRPVHPKTKQSLFSRRKRDPGAFEQLIDADRLDILHYIRHLTLKSKLVMYSPRFKPGDIQEYLPQLRSITKLQNLTLGTFYLSRFIPVFNEYFGTFTDTLRRLDIRDIGCAVSELLYIICQFPLLQDLVIVSPAITLAGHPEPQVPTITQSPPFRGKLVVALVHSRELSEGLAALPGGLNFRSLELSSCGRLESAFEACGHTVTSVSYLWQWGNIDRESNLSIRMYVGI